MLKILQSIADKISPNGYYLLECINNGIEPKRINIYAEIRILNTDGYLEGRKLTDKAIELLAEINGRYTIEGTKISKRKELSGSDLEMIKKYVEMFPKVATPTKRRLRSSVNNLERKFRLFFTEYKYDWETVLKATKKYISSFDPNELTYMKNSEYFISKDKYSLLANYCEDVMDGTPDEPTNENPLYSSHVL